MIGSYTLYTAVHVQQVNYIAPTDGKLRQLDSIAERQETWYIVLQMDYPYFILISFFIPTHLFSFCHSVVISSNGHGMKGHEKNIKSRIKES